MRLDSAQHAFLITVNLLLVVRTCRSPGSIPQSVTMSLNSVFSPAMFPKAHTAYTYL